MTIELIMHDHQQVKQRISFKVRSYAY